MNCFYKEHETQKISNMCNIKNSIINGSDINSCRMFPSDWLVHCNRCRYFGSMCCCSNFCCCFCFCIAFKSVFVPLCSPGFSRDSTYCFLLAPILKRQHISLAHKRIKRNNNCCFCYIFRFPNSFLYLTLCSIRHL